jgi:uncharacterized protein (TIGR03086 family)
MSTLVDRIDSALTMTSAVVGGITPEQWDTRSLCAGWTVRDELNHLVGGLRIFTAELTGRPAGDHDADWLGAGPHRAYAEAAAADREAWRRPGALDGKVTISLGVLPGPMAAVVHLTEIVTHGADLAVATGQPDRIDEEACAGLLATMHDMGGMDAYRVPGMFGPELPVDGGQAPHRLLLAYLGRGLPAAAR